MRPIKVVAMIATGVFTLLFFIRLAAATNIQTRYGSPATSPPYILGLLLACAIIPVILWIIVFLTGNKEHSYEETSNSSYQNNSRRGVKSNDPEIKNLSAQLSALEVEQQQLKETYKIVKESFEQNLIDKGKFDLQDNKLRSEFDELIQKKNKIKNRMNAIGHFQKEFDNLITLKEKGIISEVEFTQKREELINGYEGE